MRPGSLFAQRANQFAGTVTVSKGTVKVNGKSGLDLMMLAAEQGTELVVEVDGPNAEETLDSLCEILTATYDEEADPPLPAKG
jgi:phosphocarrier protein